MIFPKFPRVFSFWIGHTFSEHTVESSRWRKAFHGKSLSFLRFAPEFLHFWYLNAVIIFVVVHAPSSTRHREKGFGCPKCKSPLFCEKSCFSFLVPLISHSENGIGVGTPLLQLATTYSFVDLTSLSASHATSLPVSAWSHRNASLTPPCNRCVPFNLLK